MNALKSLIVFQRSTLSHLIRNRGNDHVHFAGLRQTAGLWIRREFVPDLDADVVRLMREAGAIPLCVTNVSELCMWWESANTIYGRTCNPYKTCRIVGGSSGGEVSMGILKQWWIVITWMWMRMAKWYIFMKDDLTVIRLNNPAVLGLKEM